MEQIKVHWSDRLENLAAALFLGAREREDPFETECTVVGCPVMAGWLKQYFLYDLPQEQKQNPVLACWDFKLLHPFVNDWVAKASAGTPLGERDPECHPYARTVLQWRIWQVLRQHALPPEYQKLLTYIGTHPTEQNRRRWGLASQLARLYDDYQNYRPDLLDAWGKGRPDGIGTRSDLAWQPALWHQLVQEEPDTYVQQFMNMQPRLRECGIAKAYRRITVFHTSALPQTYMQFFVGLSTFMPVELFILNPSRTFWIENSTLKQQIRTLISHPEDLRWFDPPHPLLSGFARGTQALLATLLDTTGGQIHDDLWGESATSTLLQKLQAGIRDHEETTLQGACADGSLQFHSCHSALREVEVAKDHILRWFDQHPGAQPRDVQVLVPDMDTYAPFIDSVFQIMDPSPPIPCTLSTRPPINAGTVGSAFIRVLQCNATRLTASEALALLELEPVRERYRLDTAELAQLRALVNDAGIRWGRDAQHVQQTLFPNDNQEPRTTNRKSLHIPDTVTWRRGIDRLIAGFALGRCTEDDDLIRAGTLGPLRVCDQVEADSAQCVGKLAAFFEDLCELADTVGQGGLRPVSAWIDTCTRTLDRFFHGTEHTFAEITEIRRGLRAVATAARVAGDPAVPSEIVTAAIEAHLGGMAPAGQSDTNAVLFSPLRTMQVTPRKLIILLGLNEGDFPRADQRPAFDLLAIQPRYGDRSLRYEDRLAFLEAMMCAREQLIITYTGRNHANDKPVPPSPAVSELQQYLNTFAAADGTERVPPVVHKLHGFNPDYFDDTSRLFNDCVSNHAAAHILTHTCRASDRDETQPADMSRPEPQSSPVAPQAIESLTLDTLQAFFLNPARFFHQRTLDIYLPDPARDLVADTELFTTNPLEDYALNEVLLADLLAAPDAGEASAFQPDDDDYTRLQEMGLIPLGPTGSIAASQRIKELQDFLDHSTLPDQDANLYHTLCSHAKALADPTAISVTCPPYDIGAHLPLLSPLPGTAPNRFLFCFRFASIKDKDRLKAWLGHVVGHAAGLHFETVIAGRKTVKGNATLEAETLNPLEQGIAVMTLRAILELFERQPDKPLPFAPATSYAYAAQIARDGNAVKAMENAKNAWSGFGFTEHDDPDLLATWGEEGPLTHIDFATCATTFWQTYPFPGSTEKVDKAPEVQHA